MTRFFPQDIFSLITIASNVLPGDNPAYTQEQFLELFPQFTDKVAEVVFTTFINLASNNLNAQRWGSNWEYGMGLFIAHFLTLYIKTAGTVDSPETNLTKGLTKGITASKSVDGVSVSYDVSSILGDINGWGAYKSTEYGIQLITMARLAGKGCIYVI